jgi:hypothetical protein
LRQDNLGPQLVQISATTLLFVSFLFVTVAARHLLRSTCLRFPPPLSRRWANYPTTFTFIGVLGSLFAPLFRLEAVKPPVPFYPSLLAIWISASLFIHFYRTTFFSLRHLSLDYSLLHCVANKLSFALVFLPDLGLRHTVIERTFTLLVKQLLHFLSVYPGYLIWYQPHFQLSSTFPRNNLGNV